MTSPGSSLPELESLDRYLREISEFPLISRAEEAELARRARAGDAQARETLVSANLRFVVAVAKKYQHRGVALADLINEGNIGLMRAARKFDETRGIKFISYAVWWIRQAILQAVAEQGRVVRIPLSRSGEVGRIGRRSAALTQLLGREPTLREMADDLDLSEEELSQALAISQECLSLDGPAAPGGEGRLLDTLADATSRPPDDDLETQALRRAVRGAIAGLSEREARVLAMYFGLEDAEPMTLETIGATLGITRERVRQIRERALRRLRHQARGHRLQSFLD